MQLRGLSALLLFVACYRAPTTTEPCAITCEDTCPGDLSCEGGFCVEPGQVCRPSFRAVSAGTGFGCGIDDVGSLWCWGSNAHHQIEAGDRLVYPLATRVDERVWDSIDAGGEHVCGISAGELFCWGNNDHGQVLATVAGDVTEPLAIQVAGITTWTQVSVGFAYTCAIGDGQLFCWGLNERGQLGIGVIGTDVGTPTAVTPTVAVTDWTNVAAGRDHTCAISQTAGVHCWGYNLVGEIGPNGPPASSAQPTPVPVTLAGAALLATDVAVSQTTSCAATTAGELYCWGDNRLGQLGDPTVIVPVGTTASIAPLKGSMLTGWSALDGSETMLCGLAGGAMYCWGSANRGGIGGGVWADVRAFAKVLPTASQLSVGWSYELDSVTNLDTGTLELTCALVDTEIKCWGDNRYGQLGRGAATMELSPVEVVGDHRFSVLRVGDSHACGIEGDTLYCWGSTVNGQTTGLVSGTATPRTPCVAALDCDVGIPKEIGFADRPTGVETGSMHTCALHNQVMTCWGDNTYAQLGSNAAGPTKRDVSGPMGRAWQQLLPSNAIGQCASAVPGETWCWGFTFIQQNMKVREAQLDGLKAFAPGIDFGCILDAANRISCAGLNNMGQYGNGYPDATSCLPANGVCDTGETAATCAADCCPGGMCGTLGLSLLPRTYQVISASPGDRTGCGILPAPGGEVECWGNNNRGQAGSSTGGDQIVVATLVPGLAGCTALSLAKTHSCAICNGEIQCWGDNRFGGLGAGDRSDMVTATPRTIPLTLDGDPWVELDSGGEFTCARSESGRTMCWGVAPHAGLGTGGMSANLPVSVLASPAQ